MDVYLAKIFSGYGFQATTQKQKAGIWKIPGQFYHRRLHHGLLRLPADGAEDIVEGGGRKDPASPGGHAEYRQVLPAQSLLAGQTRGEVRESDDI